MTKKTYRYEMHMHTSDSSACGFNTAREMTRSYIEAGFAGVVMTEHFFNGNCSISNELPWDERVTEFVKGYDNALLEAQGEKFDVIFGWEYSHVAGAHILTYGLDKQFLYDNPDMMQWDEYKYFDEVKKAGGFLCQAHPYREAFYIEEIVLYPEYMDATEIENAHNKDPLYDIKAKKFAKDHNLIPMIGSDSHTIDYKKLGMTFDSRITNNQELLMALRSLKPKEKVKYESSKKTS